VTAEYVTPVNNEDTPFEDDWTVARRVRIHVMNGVVLRLFGVRGRDETTLHERDGTYPLHVDVTADVDPGSTVGLPRC